MFLYAASRIDEMLPTLITVDGKQSALFGTKDYSWRVYLEMLSEGANLDDGRSTFNKALSKARISIEWYFMESKRFWGLVDAKGKLRIRQMPA